MPRANVSPSPSTAVADKPSSLPVNATGKAEEKKDVRVTLMRSIGRMGKLKPISVVLVQRWSFASSANTAYNTVLSVTPSASADWTQFAAVYDEVICDGGHIDFIAHTTAVIQAGNLWGSMSFDPVNFGVNTSIAEVGTAAQHRIFPIIVNLGPSVVQPIGPLQHSFRWSTPKGKPARITGSSNTTNLSGEWGATSDASDSFGFIKPYFEAGTTGVITNLSGFVFLKCRFRSRT